MIFDTINPIGLGFLSALLFTGKSFYLASIFTLLGISLVAEGAVLVKYAFICGMFCLINFSLSGKLTKKNTIIQGTIGAMITLSGGLFYYLYGKVGVFYIGVGCLEGVLTFLLAYILKRSINVFTMKKKKLVIKSEEIISIGIFFGGIIAGSADIYIGQVSLNYLFSFIIILIVANKGGSALAATVGILLGSVLYISQIAYISYPIILAITGIITGVVRIKASI